MWRIHIVEGKDILAQLGTKLHLDLGRTAVPMLCMRKPLFSIGVSIVVNSGFCNANGIVALVPKGVYAGALIEKPQYWLKSVPGELSTGISHTRRWEMKTFWRLPHKTVNYSVSSSSNILTT